MIGSIEGLLSRKAPPHLMIDVGGLGYELEAPMSTFYGLPAVGARVRLLTHLVVREDAHLLYGFGSADERTLFRSLLKVSGVGPRIALAILSGINADAFALCIREQDTGPLVRIPGVGRKIAERLLIEMRDRVDAAEGGRGATAPAAGSASAEAYGALLALGYKPPEATRMLKSAGEGGSTEEIIRRALQAVAP